MHKYLFIGCLVISLQVLGQKVEKTFYDVEQKQLKESFETKKGKRNGLYTKYNFDGGTLITGLYDDDLKTGLWEYFHSNGSALP